MVRRIGGLKVIDSTNTVKARILFEAREVMNKAYKKSKPQIELKARQLILSELEKSPTVQSLLKNKLQADFGLSSSSARKGVDNILSVISRNINVDFVISSSNLVGSIKLNLLPPDVSQLTSLPSASYINNGRKGGEIPWLEWLLTRGTEIVIDGYHVTYKESRYSRSGKAEMRKSGFFRINSDDAGTIDDNFITRTIRSLSDEIFLIIRLELERAG